MPNACPRCREPLPGPALFCPSCGEAVLRGDLRWEGWPAPGPAPVAPSVKLNLWDGSEEPCAVDLVVRSEGEVLERVQIEAVVRSSSRRVALPRLALAAASPAPCLFDLSIEHPAAQTAGKPILRL